jgi:hypothetical protein
LNKKKKKKKSIKEVAKEATCPFKADVFGALFIYSILLFSFCAKLVVKSRGKRKMSNNA